MSENRPWLASFHGLTIGRFGYVLSNQITEGSCVVFINFVCSFRELATGLFFLFIIGVFSQSKNVLSPLIRIGMTEMYVISLFICIDRRRTNKSLFAQTVSIRKYLKSVRSKNPQTGSHLLSFPLPYLAYIVSGSLLLGSLSPSLSQTGLLSRATEMSRNLSMWSFIRRQIPLWIPMSGLKSDGGTPRGRRASVPVIKNSSWRRK